MTDIIFGYVGTGIIGFFIGMIFITKFYSKRLDKLREFEKQNIGDVK